MRYVVIFLTPILALLSLGCSPPPDYVKDDYIQAGATEARTFELKAGLTYKLVVEVCNLRLVCTAIGPDETALPFTREIWLRGQHFIWLFPDQDETWTLQTKGFEDDAKSGGFYRVSLEDIHPRNAQDRELKQLQDLWFEIGPSAKAQDFERVHQGYDTLIAYYLDIGDEAIAADFMVEFALAAMNPNELKLGVDYASWAMDIYTRRGDTYSLGRTAGVRGYILSLLHRERQDPELALKTIEDFLSQWAHLREIGYWNEQIVPLSNIAFTLEYTGLYEEAQAAAAFGIASLASSYNSSNKMFSYVHQSNMYRTVFKDGPKAAASMAQAEACYQGILFDRQLARGMEMIAAGYRDAGQPEKAHALLEEAYPRSERQKVKASIRYNQATCLIAMQREQEALAVLRELVADKPYIPMGDVYLSLAQLELKRDPDAARAHLLKAVEAFKDNELNAPLPNDLLAQLTDDVKQKQRYLDQAMTVAERVRRTYLNQTQRTAVFERYFPIYERAIDLHLSQSRASDDVHVRSAFNILERANGKSLRETTLLGINNSRQPLSLNGILRHEKRTWQELTRYLNRKVEDVDDGARPLEEIQRAMDRDTLLLATLVKPEKSYVWAVWSKGLQLHTTLGADQLEPLTQTLLEEVKGSASIDLLHSSAGRQLYEALFPASVPLQRFKRVALVVDGALTVLPFAALPTPKGRFLIEDVELFYLPTASHVTHPPREQMNAWQKSIAIFANPVFRGSDQRVRAVVDERTLAQQRTSMPDQDQLSRLQGTEEEARAILELPAITGQEHRLFTGFEATRKAALDPALGAYRILHFASHCQIDPNDASRSKLILSRFDRKGKPIRGDLTLADITELRLSSELVVLSACETALGRRVRGAGPMSLSRGFLLAGVPRVVATLWPIHDRAVPVFMKRFYTEMLQERRSPAAALSQAQRQMIRDPQFNHTKYWSAFILIGEND